MDKSRLSTSFRAKSLPVLVFTALGLCLSVLALASCSKASSPDIGRGIMRAKSLGSGGAFDEAMEMAAPEPASDAMTGFNPEGPGSSAAPLSPAQAGAANAERKLIKTASLSLRVSDLAAAEKTATGIASTLSGYVASSSSNPSSCNLVLRVPQSAFDGAFNSLLSLGQVMRREVSAEDVTLRFYDLDGRLKTKKELADTYRSYLKRAKTVEEIMTVESHLSDLQYEIDRMGGELKGLADLIDFSTINLELSLPPSLSEKTGDSLGERLANLFRGLGSFLVGALTILVGLVVYGVPLLAILALLWWLLFGKVGLLLKLWALVAKRKKGA